MKHTLTREQEKQALLSSDRGREFLEKTLEALEYYNEKEGCEMIKSYLEKNYPKKKKIKNTRIVKRTNVDGRIEYVIQQKHWLLRWVWVDASENCDGYGYCIDRFSTLEELQKNLCYFDGTKVKEEVVEV